MTIDKGKDETDRIDLVAVNETERKVVMGNRLQGTFLERYVRTVTFLNNSIIIPTWKLPRAT